MATVTSRLNPLITYLIGLFQNSATLGQATPPVAVYDGPVTTMADSFLKLYVGLTDPDDEGGQAAGDSVQEWASIGRMARNETVTIHCCAEAWSGDDAIQPVRDQVSAITAAVQALMQADTTQFGGNVLFPDPGYTNESMPQNNTTDGAIARVTFDLVFRCRIGGF